MARNREYFVSFTGYDHATTQRCIESRTPPESSRNFSFSRKAFRSARVFVSSVSNGAANTRAALAKDEGLGHGPAYSHLRRLEELW